VIAASRRHITHRSMRRNTTIPKAFIALPVSEPGPGIVLEDAVVDGTEGDEYDEGVVSDAAEYIVKL